MRLIDQKWQKIFNDKMILRSISSCGSFSISSTEINKYKEARLMTKFDHRSQMPKVFTDNNLGILPTTRGEYLIGQFEMFADFDKESSQIKELDFPVSIESISYDNITSESAALNCAFVSKIIHDFTKEEKLYPTVNGRMGSSAFDFNIQKKNVCSTFSVHVNNAQIEIDGGYEGEKALFLLEAKNYIADDFIIRQLYYPYRLWSSKVKKHVCPLFLTYSNGIFHLREYRFTQLDLYNSIELVRSKKYIIRKARLLNIDFLKELAKNKSYVHEEVTFPQADALERVINLCELLNNEGDLSKDQITDNYGFDSRQTDYYMNAAKYLGLIDEIKEPFNGCKLSELGKNLFNMPIAERQVEFVRLISSHEVFNLALNGWLSKGREPSKREIVAIMQTINLLGVGAESTRARRASTVLAWMRWIFLQVNQ